MKWSNRTIPQERVADVLITKTAIKTLKPEHVVEKVINFQFKDAVSALKLYNEVEISGFGKFIISKPKVRKRVRILEKMRDALKKRLGEKAEGKSAELDRKKLGEVEEILNFLKSKEEL